MLRWTIFGEGLWCVEIFVDARALVQESCGGLGWCDGGFVKGALQGVDVMRGRWVVGGNSTG